MLGRSDGVEQCDPVLCNSWVEFDSDPVANPNLAADPGTIIAFPGEMIGLGSGRFFIAFHQGAQLLPGAEQAGAGAGH